MSAEATQRTDMERLNWLEGAEGFALVSDDRGRWAVVTDGVQNVPEKYPSDISTSFWIKADEWRSSVREAIDAAIKRYGE